MAGNAQTAFYALNAKNCAAASALFGQSSGDINLYDWQSSATGTWRGVYNIVIGNYANGYGYSFTSPQFGSISPGNVMGKAIIGSLFSSGTTASAQIVLTSGYSTLTMVNIYVGGVKYTGRKVADSVWYFDNLPNSWLYNKVGTTVYFGLEWAQ